MNDQAIAELAEYITRRVVEGFADLEQIVEDAVDVYTDGGHQEVRPVAERLAHEAIADHLRLQRTWIGDTDCDRLNTAFKALDKAGIVARQNFTCCQNCGHAEIGDEIEAAERQGVVRGYAFYHMQDTESAAENGSLYLAYGSNGGAESDAVRVGHEIVETLLANGLKATWTGDLGQRILVSDLDWRRRRSDPVQPA